MSKVAVVYWSGTGNTEEMANKVAEGAKAAGAEVEVISADDFDGTDISGFDGVAFGCPAMGDEELDSKVGDHHKTDLLPICDITIYASQL